MKKTTDTWEALGNWHGSMGSISLHNLEHKREYRFTPEDVAAILNLLEATWRLTTNLQRDGRPLHGPSLTQLHIALSTVMARVRSKSSGE